MINRLFVFILLCFSLISYSQSNRIDTLRTGNQSIPEDTSRILGLIELVQALDESNKINEALEVAEGAVQMATKINFNRGIGLSLMHLGIEHYKLSNFREARLNFSQATPYIENEGIKNEVALIYHWSGNACYRLSQYERALSYYLKALALREEIGDEQGKAFSLYNIANIYYDQKQYETALAYHFKSLAIKKEIKDNRGVAFSFNNIANIYNELQLVDTALVYYQKAKLIFENINNQQGVAYTLGNIGKIYKKTSSYAMALSTLLQAKKIMEAIGDKQALIEAHNSIAGLLLNLQQYSEAEKHLMAAQALADETGAEEMLIDNYLEYARLDSARGNKSEAFEWLKRYIKKKESIFGIKKSKQIAEMQAAFDSERKDQEIISLNKQKELQKSLRVNQMIIFALILTALLVLAVVLFCFLKQKQKANLILETQKKKAEGYNQLNNKLFSIISHDLRSPLRSLEGVLKLAASQELGEKELSTLLSSVGTNTQHVIDLLDNLLSWARGHLQGNTVSLQVTSLNSIVQNTIALLQPLADQKKILLTNRLPNSIQVFVDHNMVELVFRNLLSNAIKFTPYSGNVIVCCDVSSQYATISIEDNGVGIPREQLNKLFSTENVSTRGTANEKGTGLGLMLCREFLEKNGGTIWVKSSIKKGSTFYFTLPLPQVSQMLVSA